MGKTVKPHWSFAKLWFPTLSLPLPVVVVRNRHGEYRPVASLGAVVSAIVILFGEPRTVIASRPTVNPGGRSDV